MKLSIVLAIPVSLIVFSLVPSAAFAGTRTTCAPTPQFLASEVLVNSEFNSQACPTSAGLSGVMHTIETTDNRIYIAGCSGFSHTPSGYTSVTRPPQGSCLNNSYVTWHKNASPLSRGLSAQTSANTVLRGSATTSDPDGDILVYSTHSASQKGGSIEVNASTGAFIFTPPPAFQGDDFFIVKAKDAKGGVGDVLVFVKVGTSNPAVNLPPVFPSFTSPVTDGQIALQLSAYDPEGGPVSIALDPNKMPIHGTLKALSAPNAYMYTADPGYNGNDRFAAFATDNLGNRTRTEFPIVSRRGITAALTQMYPILLDDD